MSGGELEVNPDQLDGFANGFSNTGDDLAGLDVGGPLYDATAAVSQLVTASACRNARSTVVADMEMLAREVHEYADNLHRAAFRYRARDATAAEAITRVPVGE